MMKSFKVRVALKVLSSAAVMFFLGLGELVRAQSAIGSCSANFSIPSDLSEHCSTEINPTWSYTETTQLIASDVTFTDINGVYGETEIRQLAQLGVLDTTITTFQPSAPMTRGEFVAWLVKTYNELHRTPIHLTTTSTATFPDVPSSHPFFVYIQSAHDAGLLAGFEDGNFRPDALLTREEMIVLKSPLDITGTGHDRRSSENLRNFIGRTRGISDVNEITEAYLGYIAFDLGNAASGRNFERVYGRTNNYRPQEPVTRAEAAVLLSQFRRGESVEEVLQRRGR
jgi:hypothetical protein